MSDLERNIERVIDLSILIHGLMVNLQDRKENFRYRSLQVIDKGQGISPVERNIAVGTYIGHANL